MDETLENHKEVYFVTMTQVLLWMQSPVSVELRPLAGEVLGGPPGGVSRAELLQAVH